MLSKLSYAPGTNLPDLNRVIDSEIANLKTRVTSFCCEDRSLLFGLSVIHSPAPAEDSAYDSAYSSSSPDPCDGSCNWDWSPNRSESPASSQGLNIPNIQQDAEVSPQNRRQDQACISGPLVQSPVTGAAGRENSFSDLIDYSECVPAMSEDQTARRPQLDYSVSGAIEQTLDGQRIFPESQKFNLVMEQGERSILVI